MTSSQEWFNLEIYASSRDLWLHQAGRMYSCEVKPGLPTSCMPSFIQIYTNFFSIYEYRTSQTPSIQPWFSSVHIFSATRHIIQLNITCSHSSRIPRRAFDPGFQPLVHLQNVQAPGQRGDVRARAADPGVRRLQRRSRRRRRRRRWQIMPREGSKRRFLGSIQ